MIHPALRAIHRLKNWGLGPVSRKSRYFTGHFLNCVTIPFVSQVRRGFKSSSFTVILLFVTLKTCEKIGFPKQAVGSFTNGFSGLRETDPWPLFLESLETSRAIFGCHNSLCISRSERIQVVKLHRHVSFS